MRILKRRAGPVLLCLLLCPACSPRPAEVRTVRLTPPPALMQAVPVPAWTGGTNGELAAWALELKERLEQANASLKALRGWCAP